MIVRCILGSRTVNLNKHKDIAQSIKQGKSIQAQSHYTSAIRFFKMPRIDTFIWSILLMLLSLSNYSEVSTINYLIVDRTNWKRGKKNINLLTIGTLLEDVFVPLMWLQLNKRGNSNLKDRKKLVKRLLRLMKQAGRNTKEMILLADREFIGSNWFAFLASVELRFVIRLRENMYFDLQTHQGVKRTPLKRFSKHIERYGIYATPMKLDEVTYTFVMIKNPKYNPKEPYIYFISNLTDAKKIAAHYLKRWKIECAFKHLKSNGFNLEDCNLKSNLKIELLMTMVVFAYVLAIKEGIIHRKKIPLKKYKNGKQYLAISIFRKGYEIIQGTIKTLFELIIYLENKLILKPLNIKNDQTIRHFV